ncbi:helix-turn-helix domain-containing protein [Streptomyces halobius]|uniref:Helix-turn-helix transcriptional regulator n=1 Tax=Streptomyces halobius TaxID=2879846 RepID=A0ABY4MFX5_9ACTN|nr:helix-turn-helix transcriptional regulator [Streptomyces halobius]UQA96714.1 helix-turn-helix transcriptional regulator [Streptomyces halobius]
MAAVPAGDNPQERQGLEALQPRYEWRLQELMAVRKDWYSTTKLGPELRKYGFEMDRSSIYRLVKTKQPPKMPLELILALCKILKCKFEDLVVEVEPATEAQEPKPKGPWFPTCRCWPRTFSTPKADGEPERTRHLSGLRQGPNDRPEIEASLLHLLPEEPAVGSLLPLRTLGHHCLPRRSRAVVPASPGERPG